MARLFPAPADTMNAAVAEWNPAVYQAVSRRFQYENAVALLRLVSPGLAPTSRIIDVGSGDGKVTADEIAIVAPQGLTVGVDKNPAMTAYANEHYQRTGLRFVHGDAVELNAALAANGINHPFDLVFSYATLHWLMEGNAPSDRLHRKALTEFRTALGVDGRIALAFAGEGSLQELVETSLRVADTEPWRPYFKDFQYPQLMSRDRYAGLVAESFDQIDVRLVPRAVTLESREALAQWMLCCFESFMSYMKNNGADQSARSDFAHQVAASYGPSGTTVTVVYHDLVTLAW